MKTKKSLISIVSVFMAVLMVLLSIAMPVGALSDELVADSTAQLVTKPEKIDSALKEKMATASPDEDGADAEMQAYLAHTQQQRETEIQKTLNLE